MFGVIENDAVSLVVQLHGSSLRSLAAYHNAHCEGLDAAARRTAVLSNRMKQRLLRVDATFNVIRHLTSPCVKSLLQELHDELSVGKVFLLRQLWA